MTLKEVMNKLDEEYERYKEQEDAATQWDRGYGSGGAQAVLTCKTLLRQCGKYHFPAPVKRDRKHVYDSERCTGNMLSELMFAKITEEVMEAKTEQVLDNIDSLLLELQDIIHVCTTYQELLGCDFEARQKLCEAVNKKNGERGYFDEYRKKAAM